MDEAFLAGLGKQDEKRGTTESSGGASLRICARENDMRLNGLSLE